eukprot:jgi/Chlat1/2521/Chrsp175S02430
MEVLGADEEAKEEEEEADEEGEEREGFSMRAVVCERLGDPSKDGGDGALRFRNDWPEPRLDPDSNDVLIKVSACSVNFADVLQCQGRYQERPPLPFVPGSEVSGVVLAVGSAASEELRKGDRVAATPWSSQQAERTAHLALLERARLQQGQCVLVLGAAGGVGLAAVQLAKARGANVVAVARGAEKVALLERVGADCVIDTQKDPSILPRIKAWLKRERRAGVNVLFDNVGGAQFKEAWRSLAWGAHALLVGFASGDIPTIPANMALVKNVTCHGIYWGSYMQHKPEVLRRGVEDLLAMLADGRINVHVSHKFPLDQAHRAYEAVMTRRVLGKALVVVNGDGAAPSRK